jgi:class 3 adenylate cyclase
MESTGESGCIHISQQTADLLIDAGKESWLTQRDEPVNVKGKGAMITYWVSPTSMTKSSPGIEQLVDSEHSMVAKDPRKQY